MKQIAKKMANAPRCTAAAISFPVSSDILAPYLQNLLTLATSETMANVLNTNHAKRGQAGWRRKNMITERNGGPYSKASMFRMFALQRSSSQFTVPPSA